MYFIGITGGVGAGKSEILKYIKKHYLCEIYMADEVAHEVKRAGTEGFRKLTELLGSDVVGDDGEIDRRKMAERIFEDEKVLEKVNAIVHPAVRAYLLEKLEAARVSRKVELFFVEAALLIEAGYGELVDEMWYIHASEEVRAARLRTARGYEDAKIESIMESQLSEEQFRENCDFVIDNSGSLEECYRQIDEKLEAFTWLE